MMGGGVYGQPGARIVKLEHAVASAAAVRAGEHPTLVACGDADGVAGRRGIAERDIDGHLALVDVGHRAEVGDVKVGDGLEPHGLPDAADRGDRKSTRLNSSP